MNCILLNAKMRILPPVKATKYRQIFCEEFNISFFKPKKDQCAQCVLHEMKKDSGGVDYHIEKLFQEHQVYVPSQWHTVMALARRKNPYIVVPVRYEDILDSKRYSQLVCPNMKRSTTGEGSIFVNYTFNDDEFLEIKTQPKSKRRVGRKTFHTTSTEVRSLYSSKLPITLKKQQDLLSLCQSGIIPSEYRQYYEYLPTISDTKDRLPCPDANDSEVSDDSDWKWQCKEQTCFGE